MCGIAGYISNSYTFDEKIISNMCDQLKHRGPDDSGTYISDTKAVILGHRRLSILDISEAGHQPMCDENGTIWITYNGEVYNYKELRKRLESLGHFFKSNSDTEVIIHAYEQYGVECLNLFNGMFAFCIYDSDKNHLFLVRDRFGIKPLYYTYLQNRGFAFASELKALTVHPDFNKSLNYSSVGEYFKYRYIPGHKTIWKDGFKMRPGHYGIYDLSASELTIKEYYNLYDKISYGCSNLKEIENLVYDSVKLRLISDVEVGTFLSGGVDSSIISAIASEYSTGIKSFSIGFKPEKYSELTYSKEVARYIKTEHITDCIDDINKNLLEEILYYYDEPIADSSCIPTFILSILTAKYVKVALSGDGGDEVFSGYNWYNQYLTKFNIINKALHYLKTTKFEEDYSRLLLNRFSENTFRKFFNIDVYKEFKLNEENIFSLNYKRQLKGLRRIQFVDFYTFMIDDILVKVDRASMAKSLEIRVPYLDHRLVEKVFSLNKKDFPFNSFDKPVLKGIIGDKIPKKIHNRAKKGFSAPITKWDFYKSVNDIVMSGNAINDKLFNQQFVEEIINCKHQNSDGMLWMIFIFEIWYSKWCKGVSPL